MKKLQLSQGKVALVDDDDFGLVNQWKWYAHRKTNRKIWYARRSIKVDGKTKIICLHNFILGVPRVDHRDGNGLNNQRENLRAADHSQNGQGFRHLIEGKRSRFRGVRWHVRNQCWQAQIKKDKKNFYLGSFDVETDAAKAYDSAAKRMFGEFACPNFV